jgi:hypothetical protein
LLAGVSVIPAASAVARAWRRRNGGDRVVKTAKDACESRCQLRLTADAALNALYQYKGADRRPVTSDGFASVGDMGWAG